MKAVPHFWTAHPEADFVLDLPEIDRKLASASFRAVFICSPNNPTGQVLLREALLDWVKKYPETWFILDEAYLAFVPGLASALTLGQPNLLLLRSMTKDYALAGLRLGYLVGAESLIETVASVRPAWNVNALAQAAGLAALADEAHQQATLTQLQTAKTSFLAGLRALGYRPQPSATHYFLVPVANGAEFRRQLLTHGCLVRDCASFGLPGYVRLATRQLVENQRLLEALAQLNLGEKR
jgi:histidinol-phosphate/aromatic aminotransferase/cobyric acid decarboxylase-like protein